MSDQQGQTPTMSLITALRPQRNGIRRAQRSFIVGEYLHVLTVLLDSSGFTLFRSISHIFYSTDDEKEQTWNCSFFFDLFTIAKQEGFIEEINAFHNDWKQCSEPETELEWQRRSIEEKEELEEYIEHSWNIDHPEEVRAEMDIEMRWEQLGKNEVVVYEDEMYDDGGYEFSWYEPEDEDDWDGDGGEIEDGY